MQRALSLTRLAPFDVVIAGQETIRDAVQHARAVCQHVLQLNRQLRGADILAERVKQLKARVKSMEALVERTLKE